MRKRIMAPAIALLLLAGLLFYLFRSEMLYANHQVVVERTVTQLLQRNGQRLPQQSADLAFLNSDHPHSTALWEVAGWQIESVELKNTAPIGQSFLDDDPIYRLKARLYVIYEDGSKVRFHWESWRYGIVLGPLVLSLGDGPPGYLTTAR